MKERSFDEMIAYFNRRVSEMDIPQDCKMELLGMVAALGYKHEKSAQQWTPCSERLPKKESKEQRRGTYLTTNGYGVVCMMNYEFEGDFGFIGWGTNRPYDLQIVAWMPLPEPWKGEP